MNRTALALLLTGLLPLSACGESSDGVAASNESDASPAVVSACKDLEDGDWSALLTSVDSPDLMDVDLGDEFGSFMGNLARYGDWYATGSGYQQPVPPDWTAEDAEAEAMKSLDSVWQTCAKHVSEFPEEVDSNIASQVKQGAVAMMIGSMS